LCIRTAGRNARAKARRRARQWRFLNVFRWPESTPGLCKPYLNIYPQFPQKTPPPQTRTMPTFSCTPVWPAPRPRERKGSPRNDGNTPSAAQTQRREVLRVRLWQQGGLTWQHTRPLMAHPGWQLLYALRHLPQVAATNDGVRSQRSHRRTGCCGVGTKRVAGRRRGTVQHPGL
jgi:hypothetical protein